MKKTGTGQVHSVSWGCGNSLWGTQYSEGLACFLSLSRSLSEIPYHPSSSELNSPIKQVVRGSLADKGYPKMDFSLRL